MRLLPPRVLELVLCGSLMVLVFILSTNAQSRTAAIVGTVTDASGAVVPEAKVTVTNVLTGETKATTTRDYGEYTVVNLLYGQYKVIVEKSGFQRVERRGLTLEIGDQLKVDIALQPGEITE